MSIDTHGRECTKCGEWKVWEEFPPRKDGPNGRWARCYPCKQSDWQGWADRNRHHVRAYSSAHQRKRRAEDPWIRDSSKRWRAANLERSREITRQSVARWRRRNPEVALEAVRRWRSENLDLARSISRASGSQWRQRNPDAVNLSAARYRSRKRELPDSLTAAEWAEILRSQGGYCWYCGGKFAALELEHKTPVSRGGGTTKENVVGACGACNRRKGAMTSEAFIGVLLAA